MRLRPLPPSGQYGLVIRSGTAGNGCSDGGAGQKALAQGQRGAKTLDRLICETQHEEHLPKVMLGLPVAGIDLDRLLETGHGSRAVSLSLEGTTLRIPCGVVSRVQRQGLPIAGDGVVKPSVTVELIGPAIKVCGNQNAVLYANSGATAMSDGTVHRLTQSICI